MAQKTKEKIAVILFNLGGPDSLDAVEPFLQNLFFDKAIIRLPKIPRYFLAKLISRKRAAYAKNIYQKIGGSSPLVKNTKVQATALDKILNKQKKKEYKSFIAMRYWHPFSDETVAEVKKFQPDRIILLPLYPQFSSTTTASSLQDWQRHKLDIPTQIICCYPRQGGWILALMDEIKEKLAEEKFKKKKPRLLFSAHGLPQKIVEAGDPYQWQVEETAAQLLLNLDPKSYADHSICYQSRVGRLKWLGPSLEEEIVRAGRDKKPVLVVSISFVSEHSETLYELDQQMRDYAREKAVLVYDRTKAVAINSNFIKGLAEMVEKTGKDGHTLCSSEGKRICPNNFTDCAYHRQCAKEAHD